MSDDGPDVPEPPTGSLSPQVSEDLVQAVAEALASRRHRVHWGQPGLTIRKILDILRDEYPDLQQRQLRRALHVLHAVEKIGNSGEDKGVRFWSLPPSIKIGKCSHCGTDNVEVRTWTQPGAKQTSICTECGE